MKKLVTLVVIVVSVFAGTSAFAYNFWGVDVGTAYYDNATQLTFDGLSGSGIQYAVGGYKYTRVDNQWLGAYDAPIPGAQYLAGRRSDAQGIFYKTEGDSLKFVVVTTASQNGQSATELGYDKRLFGPGDLKLDINGTTYGVGMRTSNLLWAQDPSSKLAQYQLYNVNNSVINMRSRDMGTLGDVEANPLWARAGNQNLSATSDNRFAFYVNGTGQKTGSANVSFADTGLFMNGAHVYAYEVTVSKDVFGWAGNNSFGASWRPDCGNDVISATFNNTPQPMVAPVPEPSAIICLAMGLSGLIVRKRK